MKVINYGEHFEIYSDDLKTFDKLPAATYKINFNPMSGFSLVRADNFETIEEKIYGNHEEKIEKVLKTYAAIDRSLGVILSGDKGMGKSLFVQLLAKEAIDKDMPVILVTKAYKGVAEFIEKIKQDCLVVFDEFEKVFSLSGDGGESQNDLLGLFDGTSQRKRLYAITVNKIHQVSEFMVSRTGRFHYHLRFGFPTPVEIEIYLKDKLNKEFYNQIKYVVAFASRVKLNYDSLRAIAFEINMGYSFSTAIGDLNILNTDAQRYDVKVLFSNGKHVLLKGENLDLFCETTKVDGYTDKSDYFTVEFKNEDAITDEANNMVIAGESVNFNIHLDDDETFDATVLAVVISHKKEANLNYKF